MNEDDWLTRQFEANRDHLRAVAYRILGSTSEADDAVQETWLRLSRSDPADVANLSGWLTTVVGRICLDMLRSRRSRREEPLDTVHAAEVAAAGGPEREALLADSVGLALLVVLDTLAPAERLAFVLHDLFAVPFDEIAMIIERSPAATRQLASRARRRVREASVPETDPGRQREVVEAFLAASRGGDFEALLAVLDPDIVVRADGVAVTLGSAAEIRGAAAVAKAFTGRARAARPVLVNGVIGAAAWAPGGQPRIVLRFTVAGGRVIGLSVVADPATIGELELVALAD